MATRNSSVTIVSSSSANIFNVCKAFEAVGAHVVVTDCPRMVLKADRLVMPGVGSAFEAKGKLDRLGLSSTLHRYVGYGRPLLGICLGMQLLFETCHENGIIPGLGLFKGSVVRLNIRGPNGCLRKIPSVGWYKADIPRSCNWNEGIFKNVSSGTYFYFSHSYSAKGLNNNHENITYTNNGEIITAAVRSNNIYGIQFHPELSAASGLRVLKNFLSI